MKIDGRITRIDFTLGDVVSIEGYANTSIHEGIVSAYGCNEFNLDFFWHGISPVMKHWLSRVYEQVDTTLVANGHILDNPLVRTKIGNITIFNPKYGSDRKANTVELNCDYLRHQEINSKVVIDYEYMNFGDATVVNIKELFDDMDKELNVS